MNVEATSNDVVAGAADAAADAAAADAAAADAAAAVDVADDDDDDDEVGGSFTVNCVFPPPRFGGAMVDEDARGNDGRGWGQAQGSRGATTRASGEANKARLKQPAPDDPSTRSPAP